MRNGDVCHVSGNSILRVDAAGTVTVLLEDARNERFFQLHHLFVDADENLYTAADTGSGIWKVSPERTVTRFFPPPHDDRSMRVGLGGDPFCIDAQQNVFAVNTKQERFAQILKMDRDGRIVMIAGGEWGHADGEGPHAKFGDLHGSAFVLGKDGSLFLTDHGRYVRTVSARGKVTTIAGAEAGLRGAAGLAVDALGSIYVADSGNHRIRKITPDRVVTTFAGSGAEGSADGPAANATFQEPTGVALDQHGAVYVLEAARSRVRKISTNGVVTTLSSRAQ